MFVYTVKAGDSLFGISQKYDISLDTLRAVNGLTAANIVTGQSLLITSTAYVVQSGDSFYSIARMMHVTLDALQRANPGVRPNQLHPGLRLNIPAVQKRIATSFSFTQLRTPNVDQALVKDYAPYLTYIGLFETHFNWNGDLSPLDDNAAVTAAWQGHVVPILTVTNLTTSGFNPAIVQRVLNTPDVQNNLISNIVNFATSHNYGGVCIDFEGVLTADREKFVAFLRTLKTRLQPSGLKLSSTVPPKMDDTLPWLRGYDYRGIGTVVDELFVMAYDFHHAGNEPGASAPIENVRKTIAYAAGLVDHSKIILGIPFYGYDWVIPYNPRNPGKAITNQDAVNLAMRHQAPIHFSEADQSVYFNYTDENGQNHVVWFGDTRSLFAEVDIVRSTGIGGIGGWQLNFAMPQWPWVYTRYFQTRKA